MKSAASSNKQILAIVGPTASGKTEIALALSRILRTEMISCDSMQVYKGMPIVTQAPSRKVHLTSFLSPTHEYNAALFRKDALRLIPQIIKNKKTPLFVGGTGLYLRALLDGLFESEKGDKSSDEVLRKKLLADQGSHGGDYLYKRLEKVDPASTQRIHPNDHRRLIRALEVFHLTGKPISRQKVNREGIRGAYDCRIFLLDRDRDELYERINHRVDRMMKEGLAQEVKRLNRKKLSMTAQMALGIREMNQAFLGRCSLEEAADLLKRHTRNYAKRQLCWFRHEKGVEILPVKRCNTPEKIANEILRKVKATT